MGTIFLGAVCVVGLGRPGGGGGGVGDAVVRWLYFVGFVLRGSGRRRCPLHDGLGSSFWWRQPHISF